ncbi:hypothetical protein HYS50_03250 [Candidatus Woesearchaeota archaeon]|nr:hypothetical protein [Candidatus Woesearchaeota archaeon]
MVNTLEAKLEELKRLKATYSTTSQQAWNYMKTQEDYLRLKDSVCSTLALEGIVYDPKLREISNLSKQVEFVVTDALCVVAEERAFALGEGNYPRDHTVHAYSSPLDIEVTTSTPALFGTLWRFDYKHFLVEYGRQFLDLHHHQEAFRQAFLGVLESEYPYLADEQRRRMSFSAFKHNDSLLFDKDGIEEGLEDDLAVIKHARQQNIQDFWAWVRYGSTSYYLSTFNPQQVTFEERKFLYGVNVDNSLYERAVRDRTLRRLEVEQKIALYELLRLDEDFDPSERIQNAISFAQCRIKRHSERLANYSSLNIPPVIVDKARDIIAKNKYVLIALKKNKSWLEEELARLKK